MKEIHIPNRAKIRRLPKHYSWIDHRLIRQNRLKGLSAGGHSLYLFLVIVGNKEGVSYYGNAKIQSHLGEIDLAMARRELIEQGLIAYTAPYYQVLELEDAPMPFKDDRPRQSEPRSLADIFASFAKDSMTEEIQ